MKSWKRQGIRRRLALLYISIFTVGITAFCGVLFQYFQRTQIQAFDATLYNFAVDVSTNLEMDFVGRLFVVNPNLVEASKMFPFHLGGSFLEIRDGQGHILRHTKSLKDKTLPLDAATLERVAREKAIFSTIRASSLGLESTSPDLRLLTYWTHHQGWTQPLILQIAVPLDLPNRERRDLILFFLIAIPTFLVIAGFFGFWLSRLALVPVRDITLKARGISGLSNLTDRVPVPEPQDEIRELALTFNGLLERLEKAFASQDRFISNASHQLKTPLTILKGELDLLRKSQPGAKEVTDGLESAAVEINRLIQLVQDLLLLARLEAGQDTISLTPVRVDEVLMKVVARLQKLAANKEVKLATHFDSDEAEGELDVEVRGDEDLLDSMFENFIENAIKYAPVGSPVELSMRSHSDGVDVVIRDYGPGIPEELRQKIFERFTRVQPSNIIPGSGLGLSIASEIARLHNVTIELKSPSSGAGTVVNIGFKKA